MPFAVICSWFRFRTGRLGGDGSITVQRRRELGSLVYECHERATWMDL